uniref:Putative ovule protein n=1 Tax=Solanum chacoense TaxID=4108 RepID=A0A0V0H376_SOLCH
MTSYSRDAMNVAHLNTRLNFEQQFTPPNEYQPPSLHRRDRQNRGDVHIKDHNTKFSGEANTNLSLATPDTPYLRVCPTQQEDSDFQTPNFGFSAREILIHTNMNFKTHHLMSGE